MLVPGIDLESSRTALKLADQYAEIYAAIGFHPNSASSWDDDAFMALEQMSQHPKIVAIGGGNGLATLLRGLKFYTNNITAIVTVADDGGSSGELRRNIGILPPGDIRNCLAALSDDEQLISQIFQYRFGSGTGLEGHSLGNLFITALAEITGSFEEAVDQLEAEGFVRQVPVQARRMLVMARPTDREVLAAGADVSAWTELVAAHVLRSVHDDNPGRVAVELGDHYERAGFPDHAVDCQVLAAGRAHAAGNRPGGDPMRQALTAGFAQRGRSRRAEGPAGRAAVALLALALLAGCAAPGQQSDGAHGDNCSKNRFHFFEPSRF